jgi:hypothetical protein
MNQFSRIRLPIRFPSAPSPAPGGKGNARRGPRRGLALCLALAILMMLMPSAALASNGGTLGASPTSGPAGSPVELFGSGWSLNTPAI